MVKLKNVNIKNFYLYIKAYINRKPIKETELLRFLFNKNDFNSTIVKHSAYLEKKVKRKKRKPSLYINELSLDEMFNIADKYIGEYSTPIQRAKAAGIIHTDFIESISLSCSSFPYPHELHAEIDCSFEDIELRNQAHRLAENSKLLKR